METEIRANDQEVHPAAVAREKATVEEARIKRLRFGVGLVFAVLCAGAFVVALWRDNTYVLAGSFLGGLIAGNVIPYTIMKDIVAVWRGKA